MITLDLQQASTVTDIPTVEQFRQWANTALTAIGVEKPTELTIRIVDTAEGQELNQQYRGKDYATNVLSFPFDQDALPEALPIALLGDLIMCAEVVLAEAAKQGKTAEAHWTHLTVHGVLHLMGYDHIEEADATEMEALEKDILSKLGYADPYQEDETIEQVEQP